MLNRLIFQLKAAVITASIVTIIVTLIEIPVVIFYLLSKFLVTLALTALFMGLWELTKLLITKVSTNENLGTHQKAD